MDAQYSKYNELEVYFDFELMLRYETFKLAELVAIGREEDAKKFLVAYELLQNMYNCNLDCWEEYLDIIDNEGILNEITGINQYKYDSAIRQAESLRSSVNSLFADDFRMAQKAYERAAYKYDGEGANVPISSISGPSNVEEHIENVENNKDTFYFNVTKDTTLYEDKEIFGVVNLSSGKLNANGHKLTINGNVYINSGTISDNGIIEVTNDVIQSDGTVTLPGNSYLFIDGNYEQKGGGLYVDGGKLTVGGNHIIGTAEKDTNPYFDMKNSGEEIIEGDFLVNYLYGSNDNYGRKKTVLQWKNHSRRKCSNI